MPVRERLNSWTREINPLYQKSFREAIAPIAENEDLFIIRINGSVRILNNLSNIEIVRFFPTQSNNNPEFISGDLFNLGRLLDRMEQDFQLQLDDLIRNAGL